MMFKNVSFFVVAIVLCSCSSTTVNEVGFKKYEDGDVWICTIPEQNKEEMTAWGDKWSNPMSSRVIMYFFKTGDRVPDLSNSPTFNEARDFSASLKPIAAYWKYPNGNSTLIEMEGWVNEVVTE